MTPVNHAGHEERREYHSNCEACRDNLTRPLVTPSKIGDAEIVEGPRSWRDLFGAAPSGQGEPPLDLRTEAALALMNWYETTHGNEFGHDHHCEGSRWKSPGKATRADGSTYDRSPVQVEVPGKPCSCGWRAFVEAEARIGEPSNG